MSNISLVFEDQSKIEYVFKISETGVIDINPKYSVDEAAKMFWQAVKVNNPFVGIKPVMFQYELALQMTPEGEYFDWHVTTSTIPPNVPKGSMRNLVALGVIHSEPNA